MMNKILLTSTTILAMGLLAACGAVTDWFTKKSDELTFEPLAEFLPEFEPQIVWSVDTGAGTGDSNYSDLAAWIQGDMIVAVDHEGKVNSYDIQTGRQLWQTDLDEPLITGAGGGDSLILAGTGEGDLFALDEKSGTVLWQKKQTSEILAPAKASQGVVIVSTADGRISGLSVENGAHIWVYQRDVPLLSLRGDSEPVVAGDMVLAGCAGGKLVALSIVDGKLMWQTSIAVARGRTELDRLVDIDSSPVVVNDKAYVVAYHGKVAALELMSGQKVWSRDMSSRSGLDVAIGDAVYVGDDSDQIWALQDETGDALWRQTGLLKRKLSAPIVAGNYVIVGDIEGYTHWISRQDGRFIARKKVADAAINSKPIIKNGLVFITATDGTLTALRIQ